MTFPSGRPALLAASDALALVAFVTVGLISHDGIGAAGYAHTALPILLAWFAVAALFHTYRDGGTRRVIATWAVAVPLGVLIRGLLLGRSANADQFEFLGVALVFSLVFVLGFRLALTTVLARRVAAP
jgi:hypothetical protein